MQILEKAYRLFLVDLDGVVWRGKEIIEENVEWLRKAHDSGIKIVFVTNNSARSRRLYMERLSAVMGWDVGPDEIITSGYAVAVRLVDMCGRARVLVIGEEGLIEELVEQGHLVYTSMDPGSCLVDYVVVGLDRLVSYHKLWRAHQAIRKCGVPLIATNTDNVVPVEGGDAPGAGAILAFLERATGATPVFVAGKPETYMFELALKLHGVHAAEALVIGDRCDTDIEAAKRAGMDSVLVLTGVAGERGELCDATYTVRSLAELQFQKP